MTAAPAPFQLNPEQRVRLAKLADCLISGGAGMPSASEAEVHGPWIERTVAARPDLGPVVLEAISLAGEPAAALETLKTEKRMTFEFFAFAVAGAYLINPRIRNLLGYPGPAPRRTPLPG